jgi:hypothetical protein
MTAEGDNKSAIDTEYLAVLVRAGYRWRGQRLANRHYIWIATCIIWIKGLMMTDGGMMEEGDMMVMHPVNLVEVIGALYQ